MVVQVCIKSLEAVVSFLIAALEHVINEGAKLLSAKDSRSQYRHRFKLCLNCRRNVD